MNNPIQPIVTDDKGVKRFKENKLVRWLLDRATAGIKTDLNDIAARFMGHEHADDHRQLAQLIGYAVDHYADLSYVTDEAYTAAVAMSSGEKDQYRVRAEIAESTLDEFREAIREPIAELFGIHPTYLEKQ